MDCYQMTPLGIYARIVMAGSYNGATALSGHGGPRTKITDKLKKAIKDYHDYLVASDDDYPVVHTAEKFVLSASVVSRIVRGLR